MRRTITLENGVQYLNDTIVESIPSIAAFDDGDVTPSVVGGKYYITSTTATTIVGLDDAEGSGKHVVILVLVDNTTFVHNASILNCPSSSNIVCSAGDIVEGLYYDSVWYIWRSRESAQSTEDVDYRVPISAFRYANGSIPDTTGAVGNPLINISGASGTFVGLNAETTLRTEKLFFDFIVPRDYDSEGSISVNLSVMYDDSGSNTPNANSIDCSCYTINETGSASLDMVSTAAQVFDGTMTSYEFELTTDATLPGDCLRIFITTTLQGNTNGTILMEFGGASMTIEEVI